MPHFSDCFRGMNVMPAMSNMDFKVVKHGMIPDSYRFFTTYKAEKSGGYMYRKDIADLLNLSLIGREWQWHHVLEDYHLPRLFSPADAKKMYEEVIPCVLIHKHEHSNYNKLLHTPGANMVFNLPPMKGPILTGLARKDYKERLARLYAGTYGNDKLLVTILNNTLNAL